MYRINGHSCSGAQGYGIPLNYHMACPLASDIANSIAAAAHQAPSHYKADLRFAHAETVLPLLALLVSVVLW